MRLSRVRGAVNPSAPMIALDRVCRRYDTVTAVDHVSLDIMRGAFVALVGASGSGKSTLLRMINRLENPDSGSVAIDGRDVTDEAPHHLRRRIGYVFQQHGLFPHMTVAANIAIGLTLTGQLVGERVGEMLDLVELPRDVAARMPEALSGGQRQRVAIARALATAPPILLLDEALGALDPVTRDAVAGRLVELHERLGLTTLLVTHDMAEALLTASRVLVMDQGRIVADATPVQLVAGEGGPIAQSLMAVPRHQAERLAGLAR
ncbi:ATP-binding cassette domain-containing protein [Sphingomonas sp. S-NIH.Pt1_0416]|uniref:ATP-binding cassette domain-containing protein n=3 Tax=Sphingomonas paucimobilis TaxID=13689 RepID=A0A411LJ89_SPHPI|nr:ATP-binding cassette domain-containing protein [Sphingomonas paucimobilis]NNG56034.1 ATP-binding cassette domain-containing protein [Sphingomonas paucimobilis]QBE92412.1 ATP-binding cassette domain-containing protein [Sphingomonas paucimobilis]RSU62704.1 ATP-binding cassette domain-containing protein [Sphingomonas sp. S-NIH.Pt1_0416]GAN13368.1 putative ABC transporter ATP-binding protein [Sphingomonas paucimobilis NBRC 13935]